MVVSCPERVSPPQSGPCRRSSRRGDQLWTSRRLRRPLDDLRFSNSMTVGHNVLGPGSIGHLLRHCTYSTTTHARTDHWYHYDQVGSVVCESTSSDIPSMYHRYADAWGNEMSGYTTGEWTSTWASRDGWGHNTKEYDGDAGLVYMFQRWYQPELGVFMSQAPYPVIMEHEYSFVSGNSTGRVDPMGSWDYIFLFDPICCSGKKGLVAYANAMAKKYGKKDKYKHCLLACVITKCTGGVAPTPALIAQLIHELYLTDGKEIVWDTLAAAYGTGAPFLIPCDEWCKTMP